MYRLVKRLILPQRYSSRPLPLRRLRLHSAAGIAQRSRIPSSSAVVWNAIHILQIPGAHGRRAARSLRHLSSRPHRSRKMPSLRPTQAQLQLNKTITLQKSPSKLLDFWKRQSHEFNDVNFASLASQLGRAKRHHGRLRRDPDFKLFLDDLSCRLAETPEWFGVRSIANISHVIAKINIKVPGLFDAVAAQAGRLAKDGTPQAMANTVWAFATQGHKAPGLFDAVAAQAGRLAKDGNEQDMANTVWAFASSGFWDHHHLFETIWPVVVERKGLKIEAYSQLLQVWTAAHLEAPGVASCLGPRSQIESGGKHDKTGNSMSKSHRQISQLLRGCGWEHSCEVDLLGTNGFLALDMACTTSKVGVEFHGPSHYIADGFQHDYSENGPTRFKSRIIQASGWKLGTIAFFDWRVLKTEEEKKQFLKVKMNSVGIMLQL